MKRILKIKQPGLYIELNGLSSRHTPAEIDITKSNINTILTELKKYGIEDFEIINISREYNKKTKPKIQNNNRIKNLTNINDEIFSRFDKIEEQLNKLLKYFDNNGEKLELNLNNDNIKYEKNDEYDEEDFIPDINLDGLTFNKKS